MDEELAAQQREVGGSHIGVCDLCGKPSSQLSLTSLDGSGRLGEPDQPINVCADCAEQLARGDFPLDPEDFEPEH
ncbi:MAG TPA: hypothetical protein VFI42_13185 [Thermomicrobiaceae bacterium]|nr:hypothetical protein [Thermomicrobiaceae bacterium]